ncbi:hypothetical protein Acr_29g0004150 [Actinidia rufa]|uniref:Uncharacterized protein n=1 Tax=Actinidia rufa TaxID=165716 RepID=A0A7J0HDR5_9ERIC|nr:hypothetical protein Acr_29g0004150 [Actinidia rufa]
MGQTAKSDQPGQRGNSCQKQSQLNVMADSNLNSGSNRIPQIGNVLRQHGKAQPLRAKVSADLLPKGIMPSSLYMPYDKDVRKGLQ